MGTLKPLVIGDLVAKYPVIQVEWELESAFPLLQELWLRQEELGLFRQLRLVLNSPISLRIPWKPIYVRLVRK